MPYIIKNGIAYAGNAVTVTQAQYDALSEAEKKNGTVYYIYDSDALLDASDVSYDNTSSGLSAANTQAAIDEISSDVESLNNGLNTFVKTSTFTATTSPNGNVSLESNLNTFQYLIISVSAHLKGAPTSPIVCFPYQYAGNGSGRICGIHCVDETANSNAIVSKQIEGTIFFIKKQ